MPGDIISIKLGDIVPADARLLEGDPLKIDQVNLSTVLLLALVFLFFVFLFFSLLTSRAQPPNCIFI